MFIFPFSSKQVHSCFSAFATFAVKIMIGGANECKTFEVINTGAYFTQTHEICRMMLRLLFLTR